jgi:murein DD-endopeptidase MepM/ murein hydrolase activator NlpD
MNTITAFSERPEPADSCTARLARAAGSTGSARRLAIDVAAIAAVLSVTSCHDPTGARIPDEVNCATFVDYRESPYVLPYPPGRQFRVSRTFEHYLPANGGVGLYAIDFDMPMGTPVVAARAGAVVAVEQRFSDSDHRDFHENWVMVRHPDGSVARYIHLKQDGARVAVGDQVTQGQLIGLSGNSGASNGPHLHFDVQTCGPNLPPGYNRMPCGQTLPVSFRNTAPHMCGLEPGRTYRAGAFQATASASGD